MEDPNARKPESAPDLSRAPREGLRLMVIMLAGLALVALYANIQNMRRDKLETVTVIPATNATPTPTPAAR